MKLKKIDPRKVSSKTHEPLSLMTKAIKDDLGIKVTLYMDVDPKSETKAFNAKETNNVFIPVSELHTLDFLQVMHLSVLVGGAEYAAVQFGGQEYLHIWFD